MTTFNSQFNFDPVETSLKTSSYTIPEGRYARARGDGLIRLNGSPLNYEGIEGDYSSNSALSLVSSTSRPHLASRERIYGMATKRNASAGNAVLSFGGATSFLSTSANGVVTSRSFYNDEGVKTISFNNINFVSNAVALSSYGVFGYDKLDHTWLKAGDVISPKPPYLGGELVPFYVILEEYNIIR